MGMQVLTQSGIKAKEQHRFRRQRQPSGFFDCEQCFPGSGCSQDCSVQLFIEKIDDPCLFLGQSDEMLFALVKRLPDRANNRQRWCKGVMMR
jgi:hypothetical protein